MAPPNLGMMYPRPTKEFHSSAYPAISPSRPELSLKGKSVLITGGATGIGLETTKAFAQAGASKIFLVARSEGPMTKAKEEVESKFANTSVQIHAVSVTDYESVTKLVKDVGTIDVLMLNAATLIPPGATVDTTTEQMLDLYSVNVVGPLNLIKAFLSLTPSTPDASRTIIYTSSAGAYSIVPGTAAYNATKAAMSYLMRTIHEETKASNLRTFTFHPAIAFTPMARDILGFKEEQFSWDTPDLPAHFAVWLCSPEADFLQGKFLWSHWDVDELKAKKDVILNDPSLLQVGLVQNQLVEA